MSADSPPVPWLTRRDLHVWMWAQPVRDLATLFGTSHIGLICDAFAVNRPPAGYFNRKLANRTGPEELDLSRDPDEPVPLSEFDSRIRQAKKCSIHPQGRLGPPPGKFLVYIRDQTGPLGVPAMGSRGQLVRCRAQAMPGPPVPLTKGLLQRIVWQMESEDAECILGLYGLTRPMIPKLIERAAAGFLDPAHLWNSWDASSFGQHGLRAERKRLSAKQRREIVELSPSLRAEIKAEVESERLAYEAKMRAQAAKARETAERRRRHAFERLPVVIEKMASGRARQEVLAEENVDARHLAAAIETTINRDLNPGLGRKIQGMATAFRRGRPIGGQNFLLLVYHVLSDRPIRWKDVTSERYRIAPPDERPLVGLISWLIAAGEVAEAAAVDGDPLDECRRFLESHSIEQRMRIGGSAPAGLSSANLPDANHCRREWLDARRETTTDARGASFPSS